MALYTAPTATVLVAKVRRALRDPGTIVFSADQILDFINYGLAELSLIRPLETTVVIDSVAELSGTGAGTTIADLDYVWAVEVYGIDGTQYEGLTTYISPDDTGSNWRNGWDVVGGALVLPQSSLNWLADIWALPVPTHAIRVRGYRHRRKISTTADVLDLFSLPEEQAVVALAQQAGFEALMNDRALFTQWQTATHATDVSPTQLGNMAAGAWSKWDKMRRHLYLIRRPLQGAQ